MNNDKILLLINEFKQITKGKTISNQIITDFIK